MAREVKVKDKTQYVSIQCPCCGAVLLVKAEVVGMHIIGTKGK